MSEPATVAPASFRRRLLRGVLWTMIGLVGLVVVTTGYGTPAPLIVLWELATGWFEFLQRVLPQVTARGGQLPTFALMLGIVLCGLHWFLGWLRKHQRSVVEDGPEKPPWRFRWTAAITGLIAASTLTAMAGIGILHQTGWMLVSSEPMWVMRTSGHSPISIARMIDGAIEMEYADGRLAPRTIPTAIPDYGRMRNETSAYRIFALSDDTGHYAGLVVLPRPEGFDIYRSGAVIDGSDIESFPEGKLSNLTAKYGHRMHPLR